MFRLMCPPTYFEIAYSINPWMRLDNQVDSELADRQWHHFVRVLRSLGDVVDCIAPVPGLPDMTFSGDAGFVYGRSFVPSNFRAAERAGEVEHYVRWFEQRQFNIVRMSDDIRFEGLGDVVFHECSAIVGYGIRSDERAIEALRQLIPSLRILADVRIRDDRYFHLAMALGFIDADTILYYPPAFDDASVRTLERVVPYPIAVGDEDANEFFACNNLVVGRHVLLDNCTESLKGTLAERGYTAVPCPMSEFKKSGGSLRCLVLSFIEDAASSGSALS
jgi:N-dimethylarginine dimethylaminohydrolase